MTRSLPALLVLAGCPRVDPTHLTSQLEREVLALSEHVRRLEADLETCGQGRDSDPLYRDLLQIYADTPEVRVDRRGAITMVTFPADHLFSRGTELRVEARMGLDLLATALTVHPDHHVLIEGHSADSGFLDPGPSQFDESWERAKAVARALILDYGVGEDRLTLAARGPFSPVASNDIPTGQARNRRVVVYLSERAFP